MMQGDVTSTYINTAASTLVFKGRTRLKSITVCQSGNNNITFIDSNTTVGINLGVPFFIYEIGDENFTYTITFPGEGILFYKGIVVYAGGSITPMILTYG